MYFLSLLQKRKRSRRIHRSRKIEGGEKKLSDVTITTSIYPLWLATVDDHSFPIQFSDPVFSFELGSNRAREKRERRGYDRLIRNFKIFP